jgi:3'-phosphoadenosine 5'-phosphosulfate sulfotransferase (PAPS reductase)/FAD synthetase
MAIESIVAKRLREHPKAVCAYSGGADSDIMLDLIERVRELFNLPPVMYAFYNTGLEMEATKRHVKDAAQKYGVTIETVHPKLNIVLATRKCGIPFMSKIVSSGIEQIQKKGLPLSIATEYANAMDKAEKRAELKSRYPKSESGINFLCSCNSRGEPRPGTQITITANAFLLEFLERCGVPDFPISSSCCNYCKKQPAHRTEKNFDMVITGERRDEGGQRSVPREDNTTMCFTQTSNGKYRLRPLFYVSDKDKEWYRRYYGVTYSDAYTVYGLKRTGCCGCSISSRAVEDLQKIGNYEPQLEKAAWRVFGKAYELRVQYNAFKKQQQLNAKQKHTTRLGTRTD